MSNLIDFEDKPIENYTEDEIKQMFLDMFFWVVENRPEWLQEAIRERRKLSQLKNG